jgi:hypothetical protein
MQDCKVNIKRLSVGPDPSAGTKKRRQDDTNITIVHDVTMSKVKEDDVASSASTVSTVSVDVCGCDTQMELVPEVPFTMLTCDDIQTSLSVIWSDSEIDIQPDVSIFFTTFIKVQNSFYFRLPLLLWSLSLIRH